MEIESIVIILLSIVIVVLIAAYIKLKSEEVAIRSNPSPYVLKDDKWYCLDLDNTSSDYCRPFAHPQPLISKIQPDLTAAPPNTAISDYCYGLPNRDMAICGNCEQLAFNTNFDFIKCVLFSDNPSGPTAECTNPPPVGFTFDCSMVADTTRQDQCNNFDTLNKDYNLGSVDAQKNCNINTFPESIANINVDPRWLSENATPPNPTPPMSCIEKVGYEAMFCQFQASTLVTAQNQTPGKVKLFNGSDVCCIDFLSQPIIPNEE